MRLHFDFVSFLFSDSLSTRMNVGETIFRRMEQVNHFLKVSRLAVDYNLIRRNGNAINHFIPANSGDDGLESLSCINFTTQS